MQKTLRFYSSILFLSIAILGCSAVFAQSTVEFADTYKEITPQLTLPDPPASKQADTLKRLQRGITPPKPIESENQDIPANRLPEPGRNNEVTLIAVESISPDARHTENPLRTAGVTRADAIASRGNPYKTASYSPEPGEASVGADESDTAASIIPDAATTPEAKSQHPVGMSESARAQLDAKNAELPALTPPNEPTGKGSREKKSPIAFDAGSITPVAGSLALVLGLFFAFVFIMRKVSPKAMSGMPKETFEVLGKTPLTQKQNLHLLRIGNRLVLVAVSLDAVQTITEITDPDEVVQVLSTFRRKDSSGSTSAFNKVLGEYEKEPARGGYFGAESSSRERSERRAEKTEEHPEESLASILAGGAGGMISASKRSGTQRNHAARSYVHG